MRFKLDESMTPLALAAFKAAGHEVDTVVSEGLQGSDDEVIAEVLRRESRVLVTLDLDFSNILAYPPSEYFGIIVLRLPVQDLDVLLRLVDRVVDHLKSHDPAQQLWIVDVDRIRIRADASQ